MKIAVLSSFPPRKCGIAYLTQNLFAGLRSQGHELITFGIGESECQYPLDTRTFGGLARIDDVLKKENVEHISIQFIIGFFNKKFFGLNFLWLLWRLRKKRVIVTLHELHYLRGLGPLLKNPLDLFHIFLEGAIGKLASGIIVHTESQANIARRYGMPDVRCVRLGIRTLTVPRERSRLNRALFFGKLAPIKGVHLFAGIARVCPDVHFTLATSVEPQFETYRKECERLLSGIANIDFICKDWIGDEEKDRYFADADVLVLPYVAGNYQSGAASESGVYNIPVVLTDLGPLAEVPNTFGNGVVVESFEPQAFKMAIEEVFRNYPEFLAGVQRYRDAANWDRAAAGYSAYLSS